MRRVLIDTNVYAAFKQNRNEIVSAFQQLDFIAVDVTVIAELLCGFKFGTREKQNRKDLEQFINNPRVDVLNHDFMTTEFYSEIYKNLKQNGTPIPANDMWIASVAMQHGLWMFTMDDHFTKIPGLMIKNNY